MKTIGDYMLSAISSYYERRIDLLEEDLVYRREIDFFNPFVLFSYCFYNYVINYPPYQKLSLGLIFHNREIRDYVIEKYIEVEDDTEDIFKLNEEEIKEIAKAYFILWQENHTI